MDHQLKILKSWISHKYFPKSYCFPSTSNKPCPHRYVGISGGFTLKHPAFFPVWPLLSHKMPNTEWTPVVDELAIPQGALQMSPTQHSVSSIVIQSANIYYASKIMLVIQIWKYAKQNRISTSSSWVQWRAFRANRQLQYHMPVKAWWEHGETSSWVFESITESVIELEFALRLEE